MKDSDPEEKAGTGATHGAPAAEHREQVSEAHTGGESPYRNLFVPLVVIPALIVMVLVLVFVLFGQIAGGENSIEDNLQRVQFGGANEREQALLHLVQQVEQNWMAVQSGEELPWPVEGDLAVQLEHAWESTARDDASFRYVLAAALLQLDAPGALDKMIDCLSYTPREDPTGRVRHSALIGVASRAGGYTAEERERARAAVLPFTADEDHGLQVAAAGALQGFPSDETVAALRGLLDDGSVELRGTAAVSLSHFGDPAGADVLWELVDTGTTMGKSLPADRMSCRVTGKIQKRPMK